MTELILFSIIIVLLFFIAYLIRQYHEQEKRLVKAILSKTVEDFTYAEMAEKPVKKTPDVDPDLTSLAEVDDESFMKAIHKSIKNA